MKNNLCYIRHPSVYQSEYIKVYFKLEAEINDLVGNSGQRRLFEGQYRQRLRYLEEEKEESIKRVKWFESLKGVNDINGIRFLNVLNIRILFAFVEIDGESHVILLTAFLEKTKKDYRGPSELALQRLKEIKREV